MKFTIDKEYVTSITIRTDHTDPDPEKELVKRLKYGPSFTTRTEDHPEFTKLREQLGAEGFIEIERSWWNGDRVLKPFTLNSKKFKKNEQFSCAPAMHYHLFNKK
jgi:hypothetical protein